MQHIDLGLTTKEVAETLGVTEQMIYNYVKDGKITPWKKRRGKWTEPISFMWKK